MTVEEKITSLLKESFQVHDLQIINESHLHQGHKSSPGTGDSHFKILIISDNFQGLSRIQRHQAVYKALQNLMNNPIHALSIKARTTSEV